MRARAGVRLAAARCWRAAVDDGLEENISEVCEKDLCMKRRTDAGWESVAYDHERRGRFVSPDSDERLLHVEVRAALRDELVPWLLDYGDPIRQRVGDP